jgi:hypothetical protein
MWVRWNRSSSLFTEASMRERPLIGAGHEKASGKYGVGIDVAKGFHAICVLRCIGEKVRCSEWQFSNDPAELRNAKRRLLRLLSGFVAGPDDLSYALESTTTYHCPLLHLWGGLLSRFARPGRGGVLSRGSGARGVPEQRRGPKPCVPVKADTPSWHPAEKWPHRFQ